MFADLVLLDTASLADGATPKERHSGRERAALEPTPASASRRARYAPTNCLMTWAARERFHERYWDGLRACYI